MQATAVKTLSLQDHHTLPKRNIAQEKGHGLRIAPNLCFDGLFIGPHLKHDIDVFHFVQASFTLHVCALRPFATLLHTVASFTNTGLTLPL